jgi:hypothetical protein
LPTRRLAAATATLGLAATAVIGTAPSASADVPCSIAGITPTTVVVGLSPVTAKFNVNTRYCFEQGWSIDIGNFDAYVYDAAPYETFRPYWNSDAGAKSVVAEASNSEGESVERSWGAGFYLKRRMTWETKSFNASPEPVLRGKPLSIKGRLLIADWDNGRYVAAKNVRNVRVQFRTPTGSYSTVKTVTTNSTGWVNTKVTAKRTGVWRLVYGGNSKAGPAIATGDGVKVR